MSRYHCCAILFLVLSAPIPAGEQAPRRLVTGLKNPGAVTVGTDGNFLCPQGGELDRDRDGAVFVIEGDKAVPFASGLIDPKGAVAWGEGILVADERRVWRIDGKGKAVVFPDAAGFPTPPQALRELLKFSTCKAKPAWASLP